MSVFAQSVPASGSVSITCATAVSSPAPSGAGHAATLISIFAALGIGSIVAAVISRWNSVSQLRQAWVDSLRSEIAEYFHAIEQLSAAFGDPSQAEKRRERRDHALMSYRQVLLRLNTTEPEHRFLSARLKGLLNVKTAPDLASIDVAMTAAKRVLKAEWERTKFGPFRPLARRLKRRLRLRRLRRARRRTRR
jgi:hypothetical protein